MEPEEREENLTRFCNAIMMLDPKGFKVVGEWLFKKDGVIYDLSAANLFQIDYIVKNNLMIYDDEERKEKERLEQKEQDDKERWEFHKEYNGLSD